MLFLVLAAYAYLAAINTMAFIAFAWDKRQARLGNARVSKARLLTLAALGGWIGAKLGQSLFRHKSRQRPFAAIMNIIPLGHTAVLALGLALFAPVA